MAASQSGELNFDALDDLLRQAETLDQHMRSEYPELYKNAPPLPSASRQKEARSYDEEPASAPVVRERKEYVPEPEEEEPPQIGESDLQAYFLRRKFERINADPRWEHAPAGEAVSRMGSEPAQLPDEELFLYALTRLNAGVADEANNAIALMEKRPGMNPLLAFLPAYTALENGASRNRIEGLISKRLSDSPGEDLEKEMVLLSQRMLRQVMDVIIEAEALQEAGYRNRQEALSLAASNVRQRLSRLRY